MAHAVEKRSYSRISGETSQDKVTGTFGSRCASAAPTRRSCSGLVKLCRKPTATASTRSAARISIAPATLDSSSGVSTLPCASMRSRTGSRSRRGTSGGGRSILTSYCSKRFSWRISTTSRNPSVVKSAVLAPLRSISALVASVVPWMIKPTALGSTPAAAVTWRTAASTPSSGARGVVRIFAVKRASPTSSATSVNVPPMSTPRRMVGFDVTGGESEPESEDNSNSARGLEATSPYRKPAR